MASRLRLDALLVQRGIAPSREKARAWILAGQVRVAGQRVDKPSHSLAADADVAVIQRSPYVSRGGEKLESAWKRFQFSVRGRTCLDLGASTGGFTDFLLAHGARRVHAVDVGYGQLAWKLREDPRVVVHERVNARHLGEKRVSDAIDLIVVDVSFISLMKVLPSAVKLLSPEGEVVALVKPQFEAGPGRVGKKGVVRDPAVHRDVLQTILRELPGAGLVPRGLWYSGLKGPEGNLEFFIRASLAGEAADDIDVDAVVDEAHRALVSPGGSRSGRVPGGSL